jgi:short-subunit dehydrogenase
MPLISQAKYSGRNGMRPEAVRGASVSIRRVAFEGAMMLHALSDSVVVITGASSGIGRATALEFARHGAALSLAARSADVLREVADECRRLGGQAVAVPTDMTDDQAVRDLARKTADTFGRLDVWINNAAVSAFSRFEETPPDVFRRVIETNLIGYAHGAWATLPYFRKQGGGVLINVSSVVGKVGQPFTSAYVASKFGIVGLSNSLRQELLGTGIEVCTVLPAAIDTPLFQHAANYTGRAPKPMSPTYDAQDVARVIVETAQRPRREVYAGAAGRLAGAMNAVAPGLTERLVAWQVKKRHLQKQEAAAGAGNLYEPMPQASGISGNWKSDGRRTVHTLTTVGLLVLPALAAWLAWRLRATPGASLLRCSSPATPAVESRNFTTDRGFTGKPVKVDDPS